MIFPFAFKICYFLAGFFSYNKEIIPKNRCDSNKLFVEGSIVAREIL